MATTTLVDIDIGRKIIAALAQANIPISVALWAYVPQIDEWQFLIATPLVDSRGPKGSYERVLRTLHDAGMDPQVPWRRIFLRSPKDPVLRSLERQTEIPDGSISIREIDIPKGAPSAYYVTYDPHPGETFRALNEPVGDRFVEDAYVYGKMWIAPRLDDLRELLLKLFRLSHDIVKSAIEELSARKTASIPNVQLRPRDLRRLRPA
jgi:hypothetical protein